MLFLQHGAGKSGDSKRAAGNTNFVLSLFWMNPLEPPISPFQTTEIRPSPLLFYFTSLSEDGSLILILVKQTQILKIILIL